jgi:MFS family permease
MNSSFSTSEVGDSKPTTVRYLVLSWLCLAAIIAYIDRNWIAVAESTIREDLGLSKEQMGWVMSAFFFTYAVVQVPTGWLAQTWGTRRALPVFSTVWSLITGLAALAGGLPLLLWTRLGMGAAQAGIFPASVNSIAKWFPATRWALVNGLLGSCMSVGGAVAAMLTGILLTQLHWRWLTLVYSLPGLIWALWFFLWFRDRPEQHRSVNAAEMDLIRGPLANDTREGLEEIRPTEDWSERRESTPWRELFTSRALVCICAQQFFRAAGYMFYTSWFATFLQNTRGVTVEEAGILTSLPLWGVVMGSVVGGMLSDWVLEFSGSRRLSRQGVAALSLAAGAALILLAYPIHHPWLFAGLITSSSFCAAFAGPCAYTITIDLGGKHIATVFSTMNMFGNLGAMVFPVLVPPLVEAGNWDRVLLLFAGIYVAAALSWVLFNPNTASFGQSSRMPPSGSDA